MVSYFMQFKSSVDAAIKEAMELNKAEGFRKWKTVSMNRDGIWFADECESENMVADYSMGCFMSNIGSDIVLDEKYTETPICDWDKSLYSVPE